MLRELGKSFFIYGLASTIGRFISLFMVPLYTRIFTPEQYGEMDIIATVYAFVSIFGLAQLESAFSRFYYSAKDTHERKLHASTALWMILALSVLFGIILALLSKMASLLLFQTDAHANSFVVVAVMVPVSNIFTLFTVMMRFMKKPYMFAVIILFQLLAQVGLSIFLVVGLHMGIIGRFYGQLLGFFAATIVLCVYLRNMLGFQVSREKIANNLRYSLPLVPMIIANWLNVNIGRFIMLGMLTLADIGLYSVAMKFASVMQLIDQAFRMTWGPIMWETLLKDNHRVIYIRMMKTIAVGVLAVVSCIALFSREIVALLAAKSYLAAAPILGLLVFSQGMLIISQTINLGPGIRKKTGYFTGIAVATTLTNIGLMLVLIPAFGLIGVPLAMLISNTGRIALAWLSSERLYYIGFPKLYFGMAYAVTLVVVSLTCMFNEFWFYKVLYALPMVAIYSALLFLGKTAPLRWKSVRFWSHCG